MRWVSAAAGFNLVIVLLWIISFADTIGTPHEAFYFRLPFAFLPVPLVIIVVDWLTRKRVNRPDAWGCVATYPLLANFAAIFVYLMASGGGM